MGFKFKQFAIEDDHSPMPVTTDSVLLGAWTPLSDTITTILDIGTGCGILALMLAQRASPLVNIEGIDIDLQAVQQAKENVHCSPFKNITIMQADVMAHAHDHQNQYDLLVSNPPYFPVGVKCRNERRQKARSEASLSHRALLIAAKNLLTPQGRFCLILPGNEGDSFQEIAIQQRWFISQKIIVNTNFEKKRKFILLELSKEKVFTHLSELTIQNTEGCYTSEFKQLTKAFYLKF